MKKIKIKVENGEVECNYAKSIVDLMDGLFKDMSKPLLMEVDFMLRPITISTKPRGKVMLPELMILTFDKDKNLLRRMNSICSDLKIPMIFKEKYILEVPMNLRIDYEKITNIRKLDFRFV